MSKKILGSYIAKTVLSAIGLVTLMLAGLQLFILFVGQLEDLGKADYGILQSILFVFLQMPYQVYLFFPVASLLGCLIGLGILANHSELVVMRAAGMSIAQVTGAVLKAWLVVALVVTTMGETLVPSMSHYANDYKMAALTGGQTLRTAQGLWFRYANDFISVGFVLPQDVLQQVYQFRFDEKHHLLLAREIREIQYKDSVWMAYEVKQTEFQPTHTKAMKFASLPWDVFVKPETLKGSSVTPEEMTLHELNRYLRAQQPNQQNSHAYRFAFLQRIIQPLTTLVMMLLAIPFVFGPLRSSTMGAKLLVGTSVGFGFHLVNRFFGPVSAVFQWPVAWAALGPTFLFALIGLYCMRRYK